MWVPACDTLPASRTIGNGLIILGTGAVRVTGRVGAGGAAGAGAATCCGHHVICTSPEGVNTISGSHSARKIGSVKYAEMSGGKDSGVTSCATAGLPKRSMPTQAPTNLRTI